MNLYQTIAAVSTPRGKGGIAVIRISGDEAIRVADRMFVPRYGKKWGGKLCDAPGREAVYGAILDARGAVVDSGIAIVYRAPGSFTGEDMAEISCHGGMAVTEAVYLSAIAHGAEPAGRGEFTKRAFLNGKMTLSEAEAVGLLIDADTGARVSLASGALQGRVSDEIRRISDALTTPMTALYAAIDYPEEDVGDEGERTIGQALREALGGVERLLATYRTGKAVADGVRCTVCGKPNVGKSSLFNGVTGEESAIVTEIPGTTRDILRETVSFGGVTLRLSDTAGVRDASDSVEKIGVTRARREIEDAELVLAVFDGSRPLDDEDRALLSELAALGCPKIAVVNKADLPAQWCADSLVSFAGDNGDTPRFDEVVSLSAKTGAGMDALAAAVGRAFGSDRIDVAADAVIWDVRHRTTLEHARDALRQAVEAMDRRDPLDAVCTLAEEALADLNETDGRGVEEALVNEIFRRFCVGK